MHHYHWHIGDILFDVWTNRLDSFSGKSGNAQRHLDSCIIIWPVSGESRENKWAIMVGKGLNDTKTGAHGFYKPTERV
jgi:hypothetical protein